MHRPATSKTKIEFPSGSTPPKGERMSVEDIAHEEVADDEAMFDSRSEFLAPAAEDMGNRRIRMRRPVGRMRVVHRHHVGNHAGRPDVAREVRDHVQSALGPDQETGVLDVVNSHRVRGGAGADQFARWTNSIPGAASAIAMQWLARRSLRGGRGCGEHREKETGESSHGMHSSATSPECAAEIVVAAMSRGRREPLRGQLSAFKQPGVAVGVRGPRGCRRPVCSAS